MAGIDNGVLYGSNVDFTGTTPVSGQMNLNGELLVGSTVAPFIRSYVPTGSSGVAISTGQGTLDFSLASVPNSALQNSSITIAAGTGLTGGGIVSLGGGVSLSVTGPISPTTYTNHGVLVGQGSSAIVATAAGATGTVLIGTTSSDPSFSATPTVTSITISNAPVSGTDGVNKTYVDTIAAGFEFKSACYAATTGALTASYLNGVAGIGATLLNTGALAAFSVDGVSPPITSRILVKNQGSTFQNGIYTLTTVGSGAIAWVLTRATDYDQPSEIQSGDLVPVEFGTVNATTTWLETATVTTIGTDPITFTQYSSGPVTTTQYDVLVGTANNGIGSVGPGSAGQVLQSGGNAANPAYSTATFPSTATGTGKILRADGTNWVATTATFPDTAGSSGNFLKSDGTNWSSAAGASGTVTSVSGTTNQVSVATGTTTPVISLVGPYTPATYTAHGVLIGESTSSIVALAAGSAGQVLQSGGASADPVYSTSTYPSTNAISTLLYASSANVMGALATANNGLLVTSNTGVPSILAGPGAAGKILQSNSAAAPSYSTPTYPSASGTSRTILVSDGTNNIYSTETWATPSTSGNVLTSDGTNWTSATAIILTKTVTLTSAQIKAIRATPIEIIAAPGSGKGIMVYSAAAKLNYGGTNVFVAGAAQTIALFYNNSTGSSIGQSPVSNAMITASVNQFAVVTQSQNLSAQSAGSIDNVNLAAKNTVATEITGNAAGNNTIDIIVTYTIFTF